MLHSVEAEVRVTRHEQPFRVLVANAKGGCGKTTLATNLASFYAARDFNTALIDYDPQSSASEWLSARETSLPSIHGVVACKATPGQVTRSFDVRVPSDTQRIVIDTPAGLTGNALSDRIRQCDAVLIPVLPSAIDIRAATVFIRDIMLSHSYRQTSRSIAVVANRTRRNTLVYNKLTLFLRSLKIPFITSLRDTQGYVRTSEVGQGVVDDPARDDQDMRHWEPLLQWLDDVHATAELRRKLSR
ncbi:ParA family protein [Oceanobacter mangrovi]|uniref:ParA family protein n=1 Tax=Oceanobacter mangrovi TaxID=2862510 RepID=UPI001C8EDAEC|nr:ParA family protein [Oceanobacter mangrovi]